MNELMAALAGAFVGGGFALVGALAQARSARAQADAALDAMRHQTAAAHMHWVRARRDNAYTAFLALAIELQSRAFDVQTLRERRAARYSAPWGRTRRARTDKERAVSETLAHMRDTLAVVEMYGPRDVAEAARSLERACVTLSMSAEGWTRDPELPPFDWNTDNAAVRRARQQFADAARPYLDVN
ncbi:hypothetical protein ACFY12_24275 [Streptomyces sp. NPDC001339]|uniref:hypothetical protein n=1 Tax=Streptomyces sp. NPDC001339 TaxID=3364563 RepID=UPI0036759713